MQHVGTFKCRCGEEFADHDAWIAHWWPTTDLTSTALNALMDQHTVVITCTCSLTFESPWRFSKHQDGTLEAFDNARRSAG